MRQQSRIILHAMALLLSVAGAAPAQPIQFPNQGFQTYTSIEVGGRQASAVAVADFNGDGLDDLAVALKGQRTAGKHILGSDHDEVVILLRNSSDPTVFDPPAATEDSKTRFRVGRVNEPSGGADPVALTIGHFDTGSVPDVACANSSDLSITVILNPGQSSAGTTTNYVTDPSAPTSLATADFDGQFGPDVAVACDNGKVYVFLNDADGDGSLSLLGSYTAGTDATALAVHDLNPTSDSFPDLIVASVNASSIPYLYALLTTTTAGAFTGFSVSATDALTNLPSAMVVADVLPEYSGPEIVTSSNDDVSDALTILYDDNGVHEMLLDVNGSCSCLVASDLDLDSDLDIVVAHGDNEYRDDMGSYITVLFLDLVNGATVFSDPAHYHTCHQPTDIAVLPFDDDEDALPNIVTCQGYIEDVAVRREPCFVALHVNNGETSPDTGFVSDLRSGVDEDPENDDDCGTYPESCESVGARRVVAANFNPYTGAGGSNLDAATVLIGTKQVAVSLGVSSAGGSTGDGDGSFADPPFYLDVDPGNDGRQPRDLSVGDCQGDGMPDLATANQGMTSAAWGVSVFLNGWSSGTIDEPDFCRHLVTLPESGYIPQSVLLADFSGDGKDDLIVGALEPIYQDEEPGPDDPPINVNYKVFFFQWTGGTCVSCPSCPTSHFTFRQSIALDYSPHDLEAAQLNPGSGGSQDSYLDIAVALRAKSSANNAPLDSSCLPASAPNSEKGGIAIIWGQALSSNNYFDNSVDYLLNSGTTTTDMLDPRNVEIADFDADGLPDLAVATHCNEGCSIWRNTGSKTFAFKVHIPVGSWPNSLEAADFDCDDDLDLGISCYDSNNVTILLYDGGTNWFAAPFFVGVGYENYFMDVGDFDNDGKVDIVTANADSDDISFVGNLFDCD